EQFARRTGSADVRSLAVLIGDTQRLGADVRDAAREQADGIRRTFRFHADEKASRAGAKLILPFAFCLLPGVAILLWAPALLELRETIAREARPGGAFSQDVRGAVTQLRRDAGLPEAYNLPLYNDAAPVTRSSTEGRVIINPNRRAPRPGRYVAPQRLPGQELVQ